MRATAPTARDPIQAGLADDEAARAELARVLSGSAFANSARSREFLRYVMEEALSGRSEQIKERNIATAVFGRDESYDPSEDSIVRVKALEIRKRLNQHYAEHPESPVRIVLPPGRYVPRIEAVEVSESESEEEPAPAKHGRRNLVAIIPLLVLAGLAVLVWSMRGRGPRNALDDLWEPLAAQPTPVLIGLPSPVVYSVPSLLVDKLIPREMVSKAENYYVGTGAAFGAAQFAARLAERGGRFQVKIGPDVSFADLRNQPAIFLGSFSSSWTMQFSRKLRFQFLKEIGETGIVDTRDSSRRWMRPVAAAGDSNLKEDYALVARIFDGNTGNIVMLAGGCGARGTHAAAEFLSSLESFRQFVSQAPPDWAKRSFEAVLHADVYGPTPGKPRLLAWEVW